MEAKPKTNVRPKNMNKQLSLAPLVNQRRTQRNDKCPCGNDKKFKKCCLTEPSIFPLTGNGND